MPCLNAMVELIIFSLINDLSTGFEPLRGAFTFRSITFTPSNVSSLPGWAPKPSVDTPRLKNFLALFHKAVPPIHNLRCQDVKMGNTQYNRSKFLIRKEGIVENQSTNTLSPFPPNVGQQQSPVSKQHQVLFLKKHGKLSA